MGGGGGIEETTRPRSLDLDDTPLYAGRANPKRICCPTRGFRALSVRAAKPCGASFKVSGTELEQRIVSDGGVKVQCPLVHVQVHRHRIIHVDFDVSARGANLDVFLTDWELCLFRFF